MTKIYLLIIALTIFGCKNNSDSKKNSVVRIDLLQSKNDSVVSKEVIIDNADSSGWGADIRLEIVKIRKTDSSIQYSAQSSYKGKNVGLQIEIPSVTPKNENELAQLLTLKSSGVISDNLVFMLAELYKVKPDSNAHFIQSKRVSLIDLNAFAKTVTGKEAENNPGVKEMKIFFEPENSDDEAELFININETEHWLELREKDDGYRKQVIKGLTSK